MSYVQMREIKGWREAAEEDTHFFIHRAFHFLHNFLHLYYCFVSVSYSPQFSSVHCCNDAGGKYMRKQGPEEGLE